MSNPFPTHCVRCHTRLVSSIMSRFNEDVLCPVCERAEQSHPDYAYAVEVELQAVQAGNYNFPGVGWPGIMGRVTRL